MNGQFTVELECLLWQTVSLKENILPIGMVGILMNLPWKFSAGVWLITAAKGTHVR